MNRVLVTGGAGFLGSHLCEELLNQGNEVICLDNLYTGSKQNIYHMYPDPHFEFIRHDIQIPILLEVDEIYNLACPASPPHYQKYPVETMKTCFLGAMNVLEIARGTGAKVLQASTSEIYGTPKEHPQAEGYWGNVNPVGIRSCYDEGKRCAETLFSDYTREYQIRGKIARIFNTYGPRMSPDDGRVVSNFIVQAIRGENITIYGEGNQTRSFCYVEDTVDGLIALMNSEHKGPINLGNPEEITILELAKLIIEKTNSDSELEFHPLPKDDPTKRKPNIEKAKKWLDWEPEVPLIVGIGSTISFFKDLLKWGKAEKGIKNDGS